MHSARDASAREANARRLALTLGRALELALLVEHATALAAGPEQLSAAELALHFRRSGVNLLEVT